MALLFSAVLQRRCGWWDCGSHLNSYRTLLFILPRGFIKNTRLSENYRTLGART